MILKEKIMKLNNKKIISYISGFIVFILLLFAIVSSLNLRPVDSSEVNEVTITIDEGMSKDEIGNYLKQNKLIRNTFFFKIYARIMKSDFYAGTYNFSKSMSSEEIINILSKGKSVENETTSITFIEGKRLDDYAVLIEEKLRIGKDEFKEELSKAENLNYLIDKYWFLTNDILSDDIYVPLEGYLFPDTYFLKNETTPLEIAEVFLNNTKTKLDVYKNDIKLSKYTIHELITLASIVELEGAHSDDRNGVAGVFYNRLEKQMTLGSDVTTYYAANKTFKEDLLQSELDDCNPYNTRGECVKGLPAGPISNPGLSSINATLYPKDHNYYYFVADINKITHFDKTYNEHRKTVNELKREDLWYTY